MRNGSGNEGATLAPRLVVRHGAAGLLAVEALPVLAWLLLWVAFLAAVSHAPPRRLAGAAPAAGAPAEARAGPAAPAWRG